MRWIRRDYGSWRIAELTLGRNPPYRDRIYACATATFGLYPLMQLIAWVNNEGHLGAFWRIGRGRRFKIVVGIVQKNENGWYLRPTLEIGDDYR